MSSPTQKSLEMLRKDGWIAEVVEKRIPKVFITKDLYGFVDILCICPNRGFLAVQTTSAGNVNARLKKISAEERALTFIQAGGKIEVHGWKKGGVRSPKPGRWICNIIKYPQI